MLLCVLGGTGGGFCRSSEETNKYQRRLSSALKPRANASTPRAGGGGEWCVWRESFVAEIPPVFILAARTGLQLIQSRI